MNPIHYSIQSKAGLFVLVTYLTYRLIHLSFKVKRNLFSFYLFLKSGNKMNA